MGTEPTPEQSEVQEKPASLQFPWGERFLYILLVTIFPIASFSLVKFLEPEWQTGKLSDYVVLSLFPEASAFFIFLLAYSIISYIFILFNPQRYAKSFIIRLGIYTGVILALQYSVSVAIVSFDTIFVVVPVWAFPLLLSWIYRWARTKWNIWKVTAIISWLFIFICIVAALMPTASSLPFFILAALFMGAPFWSFLIALRAAIWLFKNYETKFTLYRGLGITAWIATYLMAWRYDILKMFEIYTRLPPQPPPDCYITTAAAQGHSCIVGSQLIYCSDGKSMRVNGQLQHLKCVELALMAVNPSLHKVLRTMYDMVGKPLARRMTNPFVADVAYLLLKPMEWLSVVILKRIVPEIESLSRRMYLG